MYVDKVRRIIEYLDTRRGGRKTYEVCSDE